MLGHTPAAMPPRTYADLFEDDLDDVANRLDDDATAVDVGEVSTGLAV